MTQTAQCKMTSKRRQDRSLLEKVEIIRACEETGASQSKLALQFSVSKSVVSRLLKKKEEILHEYRNGKYGAERRRSRDGKEPELEDALYAWFQRMVAEGARVSGPMFKEKSIELAAAMGKEFTPSDGWLTRWKRRRNISVRRKIKVKHESQQDLSNDGCGPHLSMHEPPPLLPSNTLSMEIIRHEAPHRISSGQGHPIVHVVDASSRRMSTDYDDSSSVNHEEQYIPTMVTERRRDHTEPVDDASVRADSTQQSRVDIINHRDINHAGHVCVSTTASSTGGTFPTYDRSREPTDRRYSNGRTEVFHPSLIRENSRGSVVEFPRVTSSGDHRGPWKVESNAYHEPHGAFSRKEKPRNGTAPSEYEQPSNILRHPLVLGIKDQADCVVNNEADAAVALRVSNALTQALLKYRMRNLPADVREQFDK